MPNSEEATTAHTLIRLLINNVNSLFSPAELSKYLLQNDAIVKKLTDFHGRKDYFTPSKQEQILFSLIE
jgi:hypothetical protein